ncbi:MAG: hypothetical protein M3Z96_14330, partial [Pseudomonadota bacterium]|nr:hypothetical protein [Pseudomonadota bacterium]
GRRSSASRRPQTAPGVFDGRETDGAPRLSGLRQPFSHAVFGDRSGAVAGFTRKAVEEQGRSYGVAIGNALRAGRITTETAAYELREIG